MGFFGLDVGYSKSKSVSQGILSACNYDVLVSKLEDTEVYAYFYVYFLTINSRSVLS